MGLAAGGVWWARLGYIARRNPACCMNSGPPWPGWCHRLVRAMPHLGDGHQPCDDPRDSRAGSNVGQWPDAGRQSEPGVAPRTFRDGYPNCVSRLPSSSPEAATASRLAAWTRCHSDHVEVAVRWCAAVAGARQRRQPRRSEPTVTVNCAVRQPVPRTAHRSVQFDGLPSCCDQLAAGHQTIRLGDVRGQE